jgi:glucose/arabinose dehydrogenase
MNQLIHNRIPAGRGLFLGAVVGMVMLANHASTQPLPVLLDPSLTLSTVASNLTTPISLAFLGKNDFLVLEKNTGRVKRCHGSEVTTVLDLAVNSASERGLLGLALHPAFPANPGVYLFWTCAAPPAGDTNLPSMIECPDPPALGADETNIRAVPLLGNRVDRFVWNGSNLVFAANLIKLHAFQSDGAPLPPGQGDAAQGPAGNHNAGVIRFGPDGKLYIIIGDNGRRGALQNLPFGPTTQTVEVPDDQFGGPEPDNAHLTGVILRLNPDGSTPSDNPFYAVGAALGGEPGANLQKVFAFGIRNSFGMAFDPLGGHLWIEENGDDSFDEVNRVEAGFNSGWAQVAGPLSRLAEFKAIETSTPFFGLQQLRWSPTNLADSPLVALERLFVLPGSFYQDPELSWKWAIAPAALGFLGSHDLGAHYHGAMFLGSATPSLRGGAVFRLTLSPDRLHVQVSDARLADRVADNLAKYDLTESESLLWGTDFGVVTDIETGPDGRLYLVSLSRGAVYKVSGPDENGKKHKKRHDHDDGDDNGQDNEHHNGQDHGHDNSQAQGQRP